MRSQKQEAQLRGYEEVAHAEFLDRFTRDLQEANRIRWEAIQTGDAELHRKASEMVLLLTYGERR